MAFLIFLFQIHVHLFYLVPLNIILTVFFINFIGSMTKHSIANFIKRLQTEVVVGTKVLGETLHKQMNPRFFHFSAEVERSVSSPVDWNVCINVQ